MKIYCDGIFDLFHYGHLRHLEKIHRHFNEKIYLIVGIISDNVSTTYKRKPIVDENKRLKILSSCKFVNEEFITDMLIINEEFLDKYEIDYVIHAFTEQDKNKQDEFFEVPRKLGKFIEIDYNVGISTTQIINENNFTNEQSISQPSGLPCKYEYEKDDLVFINNVLEISNIQKNERILEIGSGFSLLSHYLTDYNYIGTDCSISLVTKYVQNNVVLNFKCDESIFKDKYFDVSFINLVLDIDSFQKTIFELERVTKKCIYIGNIIKKEDIDFLKNNNYIIIINKNRYDAYKLYSYDAYKLY